MKLFYIFSRFPFRLFFWMYYLFVFVYSLTPSSGKLNENTLSFIRLDYLLHFLVFFSFFIFYWFLAMIKKPLFNIHPIAKLLLLISALALSSEFLQGLTPTRVFNPLDLLSNFFGIAAGLAFLIGINKKQTGSYQF